IRHRSQGAHESVSVYFAIIQNFFHELSSIPNEPTKVNTIRRNLLPYLQSQLALKGITTTFRLIQLAKTNEDEHTCTYKFKVPPTDFRQALEPDLVY
ncbi:hypothetical protein ILUMI_15724, partial [Ignelater luminosus]